MSCDKKPWVKKVLKTGGAAFIGAMCISVASTESPVQIGENVAWASTASDEKDQRFNIAASYAETQEMSFEDFLSNMTCTSCGRRCPLISPACGRGESAVERAREEYRNNVTGNALPEAGEATDSGPTNLIGGIMDIVPLGGLMAGGMYLLKDEKERGS